LAGCLNWLGHDKDWRLAFIIGLIAAPLIGNAAGFRMLAPQMPTSWIMIAVGGVLVGFGLDSPAAAHRAMGCARRSPPVAALHRSDDDLHDHCP